MARLNRAGEVKARRGGEEGQKVGPSSVSNSSSSSRPSGHGRSLRWSARGRVRRVFFYYFCVHADADDGFGWLSFLS